MEVVPVTNLDHLRDAIHDGEYAVTQAEELLDLAKGKLAKAKKAYLDAVLAEPKAPLAAGFAPMPLRCGPCAYRTSGADYRASGPHHITDPTCIHYTGDLHHDQDPQ